MRTETKQIFIAEDGAEFSNEQEAAKYELDLQEEKRISSYWRVDWAADCTETGNCTQRTYLKVKHSGFCLQKLVEDYCFRTFGRPIAFVQGVAVTVNWWCQPIDEKVYKESAPTRHGDYTIPADHKILIMGKDGLEEYPCQEKE